MDLEVSKRIDKGIKKGPRTAQDALRQAQERRASKHRRVPDLGSWVIPEGLDPKEVIELYLTETTTSHIGQKYGISRKALVSWLRQVAPDEWREAQVLRALCRKDDSDDDMDAACDPFALARARERLRSAQFDLERLDSATWGQKTQLEVKEQPLNGIESELLGSARELLKLFREKVVTGEVIAPAQIEEKP